MFSTSNRLSRTTLIVAGVGIAGGMAFWFLSMRVPPVPSRILRIGFEPNPPLQMRTENGFGGLAIDALNEAARRSGVRLQWVETGTSSEEAFRKGLVDLWPLMANLPQRRSFVHFTSPWLHSGVALLLRRGTPVPGEGFTGVISVHKLPIHLQILKEKYPAAKLLTFAEPVDVLRQVCTGKAGAAFLELRAARLAIQAAPAECSSVALYSHMLPDVTFQLGIASTFESAGAAERLRMEIRSLFRDGSLFLMLAKYSYYGLDDSWATYALLEAAERARWVTAGIAGAVILLFIVVWRVLARRQRKRAEAALRESEERFRKLADTAPVMIWLVGPDSSFTFVNKTWLDFRGRSMEQELRDGWAAGIHPDDLDRCLEVGGAAFDARRSFQLECRLRRADGEYRLMLCNGIPRFGQDDVFEGYIGSNIDITDLESEERFRQLAENIDQVLWMRDIATNRVIYVSPAYEKIWGARPAAIYEDHLRLLETVHPEDRPRVAANLANSASVPSEVTYRIVRPDGTVRWIVNRSFVIRNAAGKPYRIAGIAEDVTAQRELEEQLRQAGKMEAVGRLAGGVAHDFNNLLTIIGGYSRMLLDDAAVEAPVRNKLEQIQTAVSRASVLTRQLLAFSRRQLRHPELVNPNHLLTNMHEMLARLIGEHIAIQMDLDPAVDCIMADPHQIEQVVMNLAANARDAMPNGGEFRIQTAMTHAPDDCSEAANGSGGAARVRLRISDTGCGMDERTLERAFEPFFTTKDLGKGTGLGLSTVYGIVHQNHGEIHVTSEPGQGTAFVLYFPAVRARPAERKNAESSRPRAAATETILVAEDEPAVRELVKQTLGQLGYKVLEATDGYGALDVIERHSGEIHLLLTDVIMPLMNGRELAARVEVLRPGMRVLYMSGYTDDVLAFHGISNPEIDFIQKPFRPSELAVKVDAVLTGARVVPGSASRGAVAAGDTPAC